MKSNARLETLRKLAHLDVDAVGSYDAALKHVRTEVIATRLAEFRADHLRHIRELNRLLEAAGEDPVAHKPDARGVLLKGATAATSTIGDRAALAAMRGNEQLTHRTYLAALNGVEWNDEERALLVRNFADEQRHLAWIEEAIRAGLGKEEEPAPGNYW
jgi:rubrerythrin